MFRVNVPTPSGNAEWLFYESYLQTEANRIDYSNSVTCYWSFCSTCSSGGKGFLAMQVLAFLVLLALQCITTFRIFGGVAISALAHPSRSILVESWAALVACLFYFLSVVTFGSSCYRSAQTTDGFTVTTSGFAFTIVCFFFLFVELLLFYFIRTDERCHLGYKSTAGFRGMNEEFVGDEERRIGGGEAAHGYDDAPHASHAYASTYQQSSGVDAIMPTAPPVEAVATKKVRGQR
jgi:hypothetical protein